MYFPQKYKSVNVCDQSSIIRLFTNTSLRCKDFPLTELLSMFSKMIQRSSKLVGVMTENMSSITKNTWVRKPNRKSHFTLSRGHTSSHRMLSFLSFFKRRQRAIYCKWGINSSVLNKEASCLALPWSNIGLHRPLVEAFVGLTQHQWYGFYPYLASPGHKVQNIPFPVCDTTNKALVVEFLTYNGEQAKSGDCGLGHNGGNRCFMTQSDEKRVLLRYALALSFWEIASWVGLVCEALFNRHPA